MMLSQDVDGDMPKVNWAADSPRKKTRFVAQEGCVQGCDESDGNSLPHRPSCSDDPPLTNVDPKNDQDILRSVIQAVQRTNSFSMGACSAPTSHPPLQPLMSNPRPLSSLNQQPGNHSGPPLLSQELISSRANDLWTHSNRSSDPLTSNLNSSGVWGTQEHHKKSHDPMKEDGEDKENNINIFKPNQTPTTTGRKKRRIIHDANHLAKGLVPSSEPPQAVYPIRSSLVDGNVAVEVEGAQEGQELTDLLQRVAQAADLHSHFSSHEESQAAKAPHPPPAPQQSIGVNTHSSWDAAGDAFDAFYDDLDDEALDLALAPALKQKVPEKPPLVPLAFDREATHYVVKSVEPGDRLLLHSEFSVRIASLSLALTLLTRHLSNRRLILLSS